MHRVDGSLRMFGLSLEVERCAVVDGHRDDPWWSLGLGVVADGAASVLLSASGLLCVNGRREAIYDAQNHISAYIEAWIDARRHLIREIRAADRAAIVADLFGKLERVAPPVSKATAAAVTATMVARP